LIPDVWQECTTASAKIKESLKNPTCILFSEPFLIASSDQVNEDRLCKHVRFWSLSFPLFTLKPHAFFTELVIFGLEKNIYILLAHTLCSSEKEF
jgi:hypothetical protein